MHRCRDELPVAVSCSVKRSEAVIANQKAMRAFLTVAVPSSFKPQIGCTIAVQCLVALSASTLGFLHLPHSRQATLVKTPRIPVPSDGTMRF